MRAKREQHEQQHEQREQREQQQPPPPPPQQQPQQQQPQQQQQQQQQQARGYFRRLKNNLPYALVRESGAMDAHTKIKKAIELAGKCGDKWTPSQCLNLGSLDLHMVRAIGQGGQKMRRNVKRDVTADHNHWHNYRKQYQPQPSSKKQGKKRSDKAHYDDDNEATDPGRFVLFAECQIGKTGVYLELIRLLRIKTGGSELIIPPPDFRTIQNPLEWGCDAFKDVENFSPFRGYPFWHLLSGKFRDYTQLRFAKYHARVITERMQMMVDILKSGQADQKTWIAIERKVSGHEVILSAAGREQLASTFDALRSGGSSVGEKPFPLTKVEGGNYKITDVEVLEQVLNWDRRLGSEHQSLGLVPWMRKHCPNFSPVDSDVFSLAVKLPSVQQIWMGDRREIDKALFTRRLRQSRGTEHIRPSHPCCPTWNHPCCARRNGG
jgi:hypothetical protein